MMPAWAMLLPWDIIRSVSFKHGLSPYLVGALCYTESGGDTYAYRYEPQYKYMANVDDFAAKCGITRTSEQVGQMTSWGLMQVMGGTARYLGFKGPLTELTDPAIGLEYGCLYLLRLMKKYSKIEDTVAAYNAGSPRIKLDGSYENQKYVDKVLGFIAELQVV